MRDVPAGRNAGGDLGRSRIRDHQFLLAFRGDEETSVPQRVEAVGPRTKIVYICHPNNPSGTSNARADLDRYFGAVPDHVSLSGYVPHSIVLPDSRLIISHAGHGTVMKALYYGVPMVLVPWGRDQPGVAARAEALGVATVVRRDACTDAVVDQAVRRILDDPRYTERVRTVSRRLQAEDAVTAACTSVESLIASTA